MKTNLFPLLLLCFLVASCNTNQTSSQKNQDQKEAKAAQETSTPYPAAPPPTTIEAPRPANGIDISKFQGDEINTLSAQADGFSFVICKATEGITYTDPDFKRNWQTIPQDGFIRGAYHFYRTADDPNAQAQNYLSVIKNLAKNDLPPIVDVEGAGIDKSQSVAEIQKDLLTFLQTIEAQMNRKPMIYTDLPTGNKYLGADEFSNFALWMAYYVDVDTPKLPTAWKNTSWKFWQKSSSYQVDGQDNDFDVFNGDQAALLEFIQSY